MFESLIVKILIGIVRHLATAAVPVLIAGGYLMANQANDFLGSILFLAGVAISIADKVISHKKLATVTAIAAANVGDAMAATKEAAP